jgi:hypothetical protein
MTNELTIKDFWEFNNSDCWKIKRFTMVDFYLYLPTMKYIYKSSGGEWKGTKNPYPAIALSDKERKKIKHFETESEAVKWFSK